MLQRLRSVLSGIGILLAGADTTSSGTGNCWRANTFGTSVPPGLPVCP